MDASKYNRSISLQCPTCGGTDFEHEGSDGDVYAIKCHSCGREFEKEELIRENGELIDANMGEIKKEILGDITKDFRERMKKAFRGSKFVKVR